MSGAVYLQSYGDIQHGQVDNTIAEAVSRRPRPLESVLSVIRGIRRTSRMALSTASRASSSFITHAAPRFKEPNTKKIPSVDGPSARLGRRDEVRGEKLTMTRPC